MSATTKRHFAIFKAECERCIRLYRIVGWRVEYAHEKMDNRAEYRCNYADRTAELVLSSHWKDDHVTDERVRDSARHEVIHLLLAGLHTAALARHIERDRLSGVVEATVRHLEEVLPR